MLIRYAGIKNAVNYTKIYFNNYGLVLRQMWFFHYTCWKIVWLAHKKPLILPINIRNTLYLTKKHVVWLDEIEKRFFTTFVRLFLLIFIYFCTFTYIVFIYLFVFILKQTRSLATADADFCLSDFISFWFSKSFFSNLSLLLVISDHRNFIS